MESTVCVESVTPSSVFFTPVKQYRGNNDTFSLENENIQTLFKICQKHVGKSDNVIKNLAQIPKKNTVHHKTTTV